MSNLPATAETPALSVVDKQGAEGIRGRMELLRELRGCLTKDVDYGRIPGCGDKDTLLKPGGEKVLLGFGLAVLVDRIEVIREGNVLSYRVILTAVSGDGIIRGSGVGEASTGENKYAWQIAECQAHYDETAPVDRQKKYRGEDFQLQVRTNPDDKRNTVLKMSKKRAMVDLALGTCGASEFFAQDLEDETTPETPKGRTTAKPKPAAAKPKPAPPKASEPTPKQIVNAERLALGLTIKDVHEARDTVGAPEDSARWTMFHAGSIVPQLRMIKQAREAEEPEPEAGDDQPSSAYAKAMASARMAGASDAQIFTAMERAGLAKLEPFRWTASDAKAFLGALEEAMGA